MTILNVTATEGALTIQDKLQKIKIIQDNIKLLQDSIISDIKQREHIINLRQKVQEAGDEYCTNEYVPHPADSARDIKILEARISSKENKLLVMQKEITDLLNKSSSANGAAA